MQRPWLALALCLVLRAAALAEEGTALPTLLLRNGDFAAGQLLDAAQPKEFAWQARGFALPLRFRTAEVRALQFPFPERRPDLAGPFCFELAGGDMLSGHLVSLDRDQAVLEVPELGTLHVERSSLVRMYRVGPADLVYSGPNGLEGWKTIGPENAWREEAGQLRTSRAGAAIEREIGPPPLVRYEIELAWSESPNFELAIGYREHPVGRFAFRIETWADDLVLTRESTKQADFAVLQKIPAGAGRLTLQALFDEPRGQVLVFSAAGEKLADLVVANEKPAAPKPRPQLAVPQRGAPSPPEFPGGLKLTNRKGDLTLQRITVSRWSGIAPERPAAGKAAIYSTDGTIHTAELRSFDAATRRLLVVEDGIERAIDEKEVQTVVLVQPAAEPPRSVRVLFASGARVSGELSKIQQDRITVQCPGIQEPLVARPRDLQAVLMLKTEPTASAEAAAEEVRLDLAGTSLRGRLVDAEQGEQSCLVFHPRCGLGASPLSAEASGKLVFREPAPPPKVTTSAQPATSAVGQFVDGVKEMLGGAKAAPLRPKPPGACLLHLRCGDVLRCQVEAIDERGIHLKSTETEATFVAHERIKALELRPDAKPVKIEKSKVDRLLTLPRMQRNNPPEHLIRSLEGDYLRGRLLEMDQQKLRIEVRLESRTVERAQVTRILWLHPDEAAKATPPKRDDQPPAKLSGLRVQSVPRGGNRITFHARQVSGKVLSGKSEVLGACQVNLDSVDQLLIGPAIEEAAATLTFHQWNLRPAAEPLPDPEPNADAGGTEGMESVLVGKDAPPIELDLLDGKKFKLSDCKDKVVILDFWASWCGPCLQTMPQIDAVAREFAEQGVQLVAINLEESPDQIKKVVARLKLEAAVALDKEGRVAERYGATDIPQTVIIDRRGKVARLYVGGHARFDEQLRGALQAILRKPEEQRSNRD